ncbi:MAG: ABC transporter substrate-binding protein [Gammaproteobacteria bacterium]|nr:ABC transporter substrate-binding protein [Gammaproteobacteria bacterium]
MTNNQNYSSCPNWYVLIVTLVFLTSCSTQEENQQIRFAVSNVPVNFDPRFATDASSERVNSLLYSHLVDYDEQLLPVPSLADWQLVNTKTYRFVLRDDVPLFSNGERLSSEDVVATYQYVLKGKNLSPHREALSVIESVDVEDDKTILFRLKYADPLFPAYLRLGILPKNLLESDHDFRQQPVGSGVYELLDKRDANKVTIRRRRDGQEITFLQVKDPTVRVLKLLNHEVDLLQNDLSPEMVAYLKKQPKLNYLNMPGSNFTYIGFNLQDEQTGQHAIRQAIAHAIDRKAMIKYVFNDAAVAAESILPPRHWAGHNGLSATQYDQYRARELLATSGYDENNRLTLTYKTSTDPFRIKLATIIQSQLAEVGIDIIIKSYDWGTFFGDIKSGNFQMYSLSWVGINTPDIFKYVFHSDSVPPKGANRGQYLSAEIDGLLDSIGRTDTLDQQKDIYYRVQEILHNELPYIPMWYEHQQAFMQPTLKNFKLSSDGNYESLVSVQH